MNTVVVSKLPYPDDDRLVRIYNQNSPTNRWALSVAEVQAIWADDHHRTTYYDHLQNGSFERWAMDNRGYDPRGRRGYRDGYPHREY